MKIFGIQARINENGRIVVPAVIRKGMGLKLGDSIVMLLEDGVLRIEPHRARSTQNESKKIAEFGSSASSGPVQQGREESQPEKEEWLG